MQNSKKISKNYVKMYTDFRDTKWSHCYDENQTHTQPQGAGKQQNGGKCRVVVGGYGRI